ncbi:hypothetical protein QTH87_18510 [Variovorax sp. J22P168]|uniref:hypothetical protein n=1 Tax=Variovorax jilinensis TaxID=3053513 RepID=UPI002577A480|nr:hypothetical protein [Variovorax sp. J22P168]MDM0014440.1 hypothetical protein [Variovorax sp. J22P168]
MSKDMNPAGGKSRINGFEAEIGTSLNSPEDIVDKARRLRRETEALYSGYHDVDALQTGRRAGGPAARLRHWFRRVRDALRR